MASGVANSLSAGELAGAIPAPVYERSRHKDMSKPRKGKRVEITCVECSGKGTVSYNHYNSRRKWGYKDFFCSPKCAVKYNRKKNAGIFESRNFD